MELAVNRQQPSRENRQRFTRATRQLHVESLESRELLAPLANLTAFRPVTEYIDYSRYPVAEAVETSVTNGPGIRINGDDDNLNGRADSLDTTATIAENDLVRVNVAGSGGTAAVSWTGSLAVWNSRTKTARITNGAAVVNGQQLWVEYVGLSHTAGSGTTLNLTVTSGGTVATDQVVFHTFQSDVLAIGGNSQDPRNFGDPQLGIFTIGGTLYQQGYDVHLYSHNQIQANGQGAAYTEAVNAILKRKVTNLAVLGYSWGGGATYELATGLQANTALTGRYALKYTAYVDGIRHNALGADQRLPPRTLFHDNVFQRKDWLLKGNTIVGANNLNVTNTTWGSSLVHTTLDDNAMVQSIVVGNLKTRMAVR